MNTWKIRPAGLKTVISLELRQKIRSKRWWAALILWFLVIGGISALIVNAVGLMERPGGSDAGRDVFSLIVFFVLFMALLVAPALGSSAINGERSDGTLATLQATLLSPAEIAAGKLLSALIVALMFLAVTAPFLLWSVGLGGVDIGFAVLCLAILVLLLGAACAMSLGFSALVSRVGASTILSYCAVATFAILTVIVFALTMPLNSETRTTTYGTYQIPPSIADPYDESGQIKPEYRDEFECVEYTSESTRYHTERTWWILAANPFVILADAAPRAGADPNRGFDVLGMIRAGVREAKDGPDWQNLPIGECGQLQSAPGAGHGAESEPDTGSAAWPIGLALHLTLGAAGFFISVKRLEAPVKKLPKGVRIA